jgi:NAD(P)-dependent dehydrogenase (short-subunit alcohol dehydrogenase family)
MGRLGQPSEIGKTARFLLSTDASYITGTYVVVDGGTTITDT